MSRDTLNSLAETTDFDTKLLSQKFNKEDNPLKHLKPKQRKFLKEYIRTKNKIESWMKAHNCKTKESALVASNRFLKKHPDVIDWLYELSGLGDDDFAKVIREGMEAKKTQFYLGKNYEEADHYARFKAVELGLKVRGKDTPKSGGQVSINIVSDSKTGTFRISDNEEVIDAELV